MKIAILSISNGHIDRGVEVWVDEIAKRLKPVGHQVTILQAGADAWFFPHQSSRWNLLYHLSVLLFTLHCLGNLWKGQYDWVIPINGYSQVVLCRIVRWLCGGKLMIVGHAGIGRDDRFNIVVGRPDVFVALTSRAFEWAKRIVGVGRMQYAPTKIIYIANGVDTEVFRQEGTGAKISLKKPIVLCVSALVPYKRTDLLIHAAAKTEASLLLIGDGSEKEAVVSLGNKLLGERFAHIAHVPHAKMPSYYRAADVFSLPSKESEAFGLVYLEAMACNVPVVAPDDENRRTIVGAGGIVCAVEKEHDYAAALKKAISEQWGNKPRKQAEKYSWESVAEVYDKTFRSTTV